MKAVAIDPSARKVEIADVPEPQIDSPRQVKLRMLEVGVCGTDREICAFEYGTPPRGDQHLVIGHESLGEVIEVGPEVRRVAVGDLVVPMVRRPCPHAHCLACRNERQDFCFTGDITERGIKEAHGFMTELVVDDERYMNKVPSGLRDFAVLVEPLTIAEKAIAQIWQVQMRLPWACPIEEGRKGGHCHRALALGAGPVGLLGAMALAHHGFRTFVYSRDDAGSEKAKITAAIGAEYIPASDCAIEDLPKRIGNIDVVYEATGASKASFELLKHLGVNGAFAFTGVPGRKAPVDVDTDLLMRNMVLKNQVLFGTVNANRDAFESAIQDLESFQSRWPDALGALITGRFPMESYRDLLLGAPAGIKNVIEIG
jgi:threonine dehydrogenase-like Zn-dependent dehydrogenase